MTIAYFIKGENNRYISRTYASRKITIGEGVTQEGYYIGEVTELNKCYIFKGKKYIPIELDIPSFIEFNPSIARAGIDGNTVRYLLLRHKKSDALFVGCTYILSDCHFKYRGIYFTDLLTFVDGNVKKLDHGWPYSGQPNSDQLIAQYWKKYGNNYEEDFEIVRELNGSLMSRDAWAFAQASFCLSLW